MGNGASAAMVGKADALPGRAEAVKVAEEHFVLKGNRQVAPFPEGLEVSACGVCACVTPALEASDGRPPTCCRRSLLLWGHGAGLYRVTASNWSPSQSTRSTALTPPQMVSSTSLSSCLFLIHVIPFLPVPPPYTALHSPVSSPPVLPTHRTPLPPLPPLCPPSSSSAPRPLDLFVGTLDGHV